MKMSNCTRFLLLLSSLVCAIPSFASTIQGRVVGVTDGDTVKVLDASNTLWKIRLMGIDSPEKKQAYGNKAKEHLSDLVYDKQVKVEYHKKDKYGRIVGKIFVDSVDANLEQVRAGFAWHYKKYEKEQPMDERSIYSAAEEQARAAKLGLWSDPKPIPPWEWRKLQKK